VLRQGEVMQMGTHEELMSEEGIYRNLYTTQQKTMAGATPEISGELVAAKGGAQ